MKQENDGTIVGVCVVASLIVGSVFTIFKLFQKPKNENKTFKKSDWLHQNTKSS